MIASASSSSGSGSAHDLKAARRTAGQQRRILAEPGRILALERAGELDPVVSWIVRTTIRPMRPAAPLTISLMSAISRSPIGGQPGCGPS